MTDEMLRKCLVCSTKYDAALTYEGKPGGRGRRKFCTERCRKIRQKAGGYDAVLLLALRRPVGGVLVTHDRVGAVVHALGDSNADGCRWAACNVTGRFVPTSEDWRQYAEAPGRHCPDCEFLLAQRSSAA
jgi:hypothetical protein